MKSCECIETIKNAGYELGIKGQMFDVSKNEHSSLKIETGYGLPAKKGKGSTSFRINNCPFCGRALHEVTPETMAERKKETV